MNTFRIIDSPVGGLVLIARKDKLVGLFHEYHSPEPSPVLLGLPFEEGSLANQQTEPKAQDLVDRQAASEVFRATSYWLRAYFRGEIAEAPASELLMGTEFQRRVWAAVAAVPHGQTRTYKELAADLGNEAMGRAVGAAVRANPLSILIPGHRVVGRGGTITGYAAGVAVKRALLQLESAVTAGTAA